MTDPMILKFNSLLTEAERELLDGLDSPVKIQDFLDQTEYSADSFNRSALRVLRDRIAHCLDGALFAAAILRRNGYPAMILDMLPEPGLDDDHVLTIYRQGAGYGAIAKSNFVGLRFREAVYRTPRELVMSYFESFFNVDGRKTLRAFTRIINLKAYDRSEWIWSDQGVDRIEKRLYGLKRIPLFEDKIAASLAPVDALTYQAGMLVVNYAGLYQPKREQNK